MRRDCHVLSRSHLSNLPKKREREKIRDLQRNECKEELQVASVCFPCLVLQHLQCSTVERLKTGERRGT